MKIVCISDSHCQLDKVTLPEGDLLIHAGDASYRGNVQEVAQFNSDLGKIKDKFKYGILFTPGNHDRGYQRDESLFRSMTTNATVLIDQSIEIEGQKIYMSPYQPEFCSWAFNVPRGKQLAEKWAQIPDDTNILVTHGPPMSILDPVKRFNHRTGEQEVEHVGCMDLYNRIQELSQLKLHVFGHLHDGYGQKKIGNTTFVNASICTEEYKPKNLPIIIEI